MRICRRIAFVRRQVEQLAALAEARTAQADGYRSDNRYWPLTEVETEVVVGAELLAALAAGADVIRYR